MNVPTHTPLSANKVSSDRQSEPDTSSWVGRACSARCRRSSAARRALALTAVLSVANAGARRAAFLLAHVSPTSSPVRPTTRAVVARLGRCWREGARLGNAGRRPGRGRSEGGAARQDGRPMLRLGPMDRRTGRGSSRRHYEGLDALDAYFTEYLRLAPRRCCGRGGCGVVRRLALRLSSRSRRRRCRCHPHRQEHRRPRRPGHRRRAPCRATCWSCCGRCRCSRRFGAPGAGRSGPQGE